jgi:hypothetical protein
MTLTVPPGLRSGGHGGAGYSGDPDIDQLARRVATRTLSGRVVFRWMIVVIALLALSPVLHLFESHPRWIRVSAQASAVVMWLAIAVTQSLGLRRSRRYLR